MTHLTPSLLGPLIEPLTRPLEDGGSVTYKLVRHPVRKNNPNRPPTGVTGKAWRKQCKAARRELRA